MTAGCRAFGALTTALLFLMSCASTSRGSPVPQVAPTPAPEEEAVPPEPPAAPEFVASEALKKKTFQEVSEVIGAIDRIIAAGDYDGWLGYLTEAYIASRGSPGFLAKASEAGVLRKKGIVLRDLQDYFDNVVVMSRQQAPLDEITFVDETHVKAYTRVQGTLYILYYLVREDDRWKIGVPPGGDS
jgi:hypothetical protein